MFHFTPTLNPANGWSPKLSPNGRYLLHGINQLYGVDLFPGGLPTEVALAGTTNFFTAGFISDASGYYANFSATEMRAYATPGWADSLIFSGAGATGTYIQAWNGHWGTFNAGVYTVDGVAWTPSLGGGSASGMGLAGNWVAYTITGNIVVVESINHATVRQIPGAPSGSIGAWRVFEGPDGGYLFFVSNGQLWINNPANLTILANLPGSTCESDNGGFGALSWRGTQLWVTTYAYKPAEGIYYTLLRPVGDSQVVALANTAANNFSMGMGQWPTGWTICGATDGALSVWVEVPYDAVRSSFLGSTGTGATFPGSGGGTPPGGGTTNPGGSPGTGPIDSDNKPPPTDLPVADPRTYPHIPEIKDWPTQQSLKLAWDRLGAQAVASDSLKAVVDAQTATIEILKAEIAALKART